MGFDIRLEDEHGERLEDIGDPRKLLQRLLPGLEDESFACLRFVDPYGDTTFNKLQMNTFLRELSQVSSGAATEEERELLEEVRRLAEQCKSGTHLYVKFYGD